MSKWWLETEKSTKLKTFPGLSKFIKIPESPIGGYYGYDNDGDKLVTGCCRGVNIVLFFSPECLKYFPLIDKIVDGGDGPSYGKVRSILSPCEYIDYNLSPSS